MTPRHRPFRLCGLAGAIAALLPTPPVRAQTPTAYTLEAPPEIRALLKQIPDLEKRDAAIAELVKTGKATPFLKFERIAATDENYKSGLDEALAAVESQLAKRNRARAVTWLKEKRIDLFVEVLGSDQISNDDAVGMFDEVLSVFIDPPSLHLRMNGFALLRQRARHITGPVVTVRPEAGPTLVRADVCKMRPYSRQNLIMAVRDEIRDIKGDLGDGGWEACIVLVNGGVHAQGMENCLIVSDGDLELSTDNLDYSIVVARGSILSSRRITSIKNSLLLAGGNINLGRSKLIGSSYCMALGSLTIGSGNKEPPKLAQPIRPLFGLRFLDLAEFGIELQSLKEGVKVAKVADWSPFAAHDIRAGDVIWSSNDVEVNSPAAFRHQLRRAILSDYTLLRIQRDGKRLTRIVFLDGIPTDPADRIAPPPRQRK
jgi:hypothetical protein